MFALSRSLPIATVRSMNEGEKYYVYPGVNILANAPINIVEINKHFGKTWKGIRKIQHLRAS